MPTTTPEKPSASKDIPKIARHVPVPVQNMLWGKSAGRCEFAGCNRPLSRSPVTQEQVNIAQKAHIYAFSEGGPRAKDDLPDGDINDLPNLMLVCHPCHQKIDQDCDRYPAELLREMKRRHEKRIEVVTGIDDDKHTHVLLYGANIGSQPSPLSFGSAATALFPERYPADANAIDLQTINSSFLDRDAQFWEVERECLRRKYAQRVDERLSDGSVSHLSVFALAPQPLLIQLGALLTDLTVADVYQLQREPVGWSWAEEPSQFHFDIERPDSTHGAPVLRISLSASVSDDRIYSVLGDDISIWTLTIDQPNNDFLKSRTQLGEFRVTVRSLMEEIKMAHGQNSTLHIFPAMPVATAVELGRIRMPKADLSWIIYDQVNDLGGFIPTFTIE